MTGKGNYTSVKDIPFSDLRMDVGLLQYISTQLKQGIPPEEITQMLVSRGWPLEAIDAGFKYIATHPNQIENHLQVFSGKLRNPLELAHDAFILLKNRLVPILIINCLPSLFSIIFTFFITFYISYLTGTEETVNQTITVMNIETTVKLSEIPFGQLMFIFMFLGTFIFGWTQTTLYALIVKKDRSFTIADAFHLGLTKLIPFIWLMMLVFIFLFPGMALFFIPGIVCMVWFLLSPFILMAENIHGFAALMKSKEYVRGKWFAVFWRLICVTIFVSVGSVILGLILGAFTGIAPKSPIIPIINSILLFIYSLITWPFAILYFSCIYDDLRMSRGNFDFQPSQKSKILFWILVAFSVFSIIGIVFASISGYKQFVGQKTEMQKLNDTQYIHMALDNHFQEKGFYPSSVNELLPVYLQDIPIDPETRKPYEYTQTENGNNFELCAVYKILPSKGRQCLSSYLKPKQEVSPTTPVVLPIPKSADSTRISHLATLQLTLYKYMLDTETLPDSLADLEKEYHLKHEFTVPTDPVTHTPYRYKKLDNGLDYELCATFDTIARNDSNTICFSFQQSAEDLLIGLR